MKLLKIREAARKIGLTTREIYKYIELGELPVVVLGEKRGMRILEKDVEWFSRDGGPHRPPCSPKAKVKDAGGNKKFES